MGDLFANADEVLSWLGENASIPKALRTLVSLYKESISVGGRTESRDPHWLKAYPELYAEDTPGNEKSLLPDESWASIPSFVELPYWSRMWIFQEIVLSRPERLIFLTPVEPYAFSADDLRVALGRCDAIGLHFLQQANPDFISETIWRSLQQFRELGHACKKIQRLLVVRRHLHDNRPSKADRAGLCILSAFRHNTRASNPLEYYYSLLGVSQLNLRPEYNAKIQVETVCIDFVRAYLSATSGSRYTLLFLHDALGTEGKAHCLPSWAPHYHLPHTMYGRNCGVDSKADADQGVFGVPPDDGGFEARLEGLTLLAEGISIGPVQLVSNQPNQNFPRPRTMNTFLLEFERRHKAHYVTGIPSATAYLATLMRDVDGQHDGWKSLITLRCLSGLSEEDSIQERETWRLLKQLLLNSIHESVSCGEDEVLTANSEWSRALRELGSLRLGRLFELEGGYLGMAPEDVETGDIVCVLNGIQHPVILRPLTDDSYEFVGPCFVLGLMKGEARAFLCTGRRFSHMI